MTTQTNQKGFTIIELLIVIVVIGILATITAIALGGANERARDAARESDARSLRQALETYYTLGNSVYPTLADMNSETFRDEHFQGLDEEVFTDPNGTTSDLTDDENAVNQYIYEPEGCDVDLGGCTSYTLTVNLESGDAIERENQQ
jgi:prepilin-type N-terminal cleavage/methylation domain-containing protein